MIMPSVKTAERRRGESLVERQARVGIVANPNRVPTKAPVPRDVWARWPDLRSSQKRKARVLADASRALAADQDALSAFASSVRRTGGSRGTAASGSNAALRVRLQWAARGLWGLAIVALIWLAHLVWTRM